MGVTYYTLERPSVFMYLTLLKYYFEMLVGLRFDTKIITYMQVSIITLEFKNIGSSIDYNYRSKGWMEFLIQ